MRTIFYILSVGFLSLYSCQQINNDKEITNQSESVSVIEDYTITNLYDAFGKTKDGLTKDFNSDMQKFSEVEKPSFMNEEGKLVNANDHVRNIDSEIEGIESVLVCAHG